MYKFTNPPFRAWGSAESMNLASSVFPVLRRGGVGAILFKVFKRGNKLCVSYRFVNPDKKRVSQEKLFGDDANISKSIDSMLLGVTCEQTGLWSLEVNTGLLVLQGTARWDKDKKKVVYTQWGSMRDWIAHSLTSPSGHKFVRDYQDD